MYTRYFLVSRIFFYHIVLLLLHKTTNLLCFFKKRRGFGKLCSIFAYYNNEDKPYFVNFKSIVQ